MTNTDNQVKLSQKEVAFQEEFITIFDEVFFIP